ncbi:hypothetical protein ASG36_09025 [Geodermatophilus sp. Leaf369]|uniref:GAF domain-containing SpoIIE family protein phosphatase n=1 Tax=Geodermatophilus sp. Leaf369 TaxID=1736354 RepID=UPI0006F2FD43|nr:SpoIIE family protein phosphatase [Geodermatophilus sp. Leaf369]KQS58248.1 hypothetical protein ASG36_09025 [Geodermatophilus sp. Leaf369]
MTISRQGTDSGELTQPLRLPLPLPVATPLPARTDEAFERFARLAARQLRVPIALVSLVDADRQVFPGAVGLPEPFATERSMPISWSLCQHVVTTAGPLAVPDAREHPLLRDSLAIPGLGLIAYAGHPLVDAEGRVIGALCAIDTETRTWTTDDLGSLADLASACSSELRLRTLQLRADAAADAEAESGRQSRLLLALSETLNRTETVADVASTVAQLATRRLGVDRAVVSLQEGHRRDLVPVTADGRPGTGSWRPRPQDEPHPATLTALDGRERWFADAAATRAAVPGLTEDVAPFEANLHLPLDLVGQERAVLSLVWTSRRDITPAGRLVIRALARYVAQALQRALLLAERRGVAETLQRAMLTELPAPDRLAVAARYLPSHAQDQVGGDWYDAFTTPDGTTVLAIGDVTGHDTAAAASMGQLRTLLRGFAFDRSEVPSQSVHRVDRAAAGLDLDTLATLLLARVERLDLGARVTWSNAGHPPPLLVHPDGAVELLVTPPDVLIGVDPTRLRHDHVRDLPVGSTLVLYTDGLVEHRDRDLDVGTGDLARALAGQQHRPVDELLDDVLTSLTGPARDDDIAVLAVRVLA